MDQSLKEFRGNIYENDLYLAAELGKALLERNKELESQLTASQKNEQEQRQDIMLLAKQVEILRKANDSRMRYYEEVDRAIQDMENTNKKLQGALKHKTEELGKAQETVEKLEQACVELRTKLEAHFTHECGGSQPSGGATVSTADALVSPVEEINTFTQKEKEEMQDVISSLKLQFSLEESKRIKLEEDLEKSKENNHQLMLKIKGLYEELTKKEEITRKRVVKKESETTCAQCSSRAAAVVGADLSDHEDFLEHDIDNLPRREVFRLRCGGSAFGSRESLSNLGLEAVTPTLESCGEILASSLVNQEVKPKSSCTLLGELEEQYRKLVTKYEVLTDIRNKRTTAATSTHDDAHESQNNSENSAPVKMRPNSLKLSKEVQTAWRKSTCGLDFTSPIDPTDGCFESGPPEYRRLFKEIFETLRSAATHIETPSPDLRS